MMNSKIIMAMCGAGIVCAIAQKLLDMMGKPNYGQFLDIACFSGIATASLGIMVKLLKVLSNI